MERIMCNEYNRFCNQNYSLLIKIIDMTAF